MCEFVRAAKFDWMGVFGYSDEDEAKAIAFDSKNHARTSESRKKTLMRIQKSIRKRAKKAWVGQTVDLLVEGESEESPLLWEGRTQFHAPEIDGTVYINDFGPYEALTPGRFYRCEITEAHEYDVVARIVEEAGGASDDAIG